MILLSGVILFNCTSEVEHDTLEYYMGKYYDTNTSEPFSGKAIKRYPDQSIMSITSYKGGKRNGSYIKYWAGGQKLKEFEYTDGELDGTSEWWYENGQKASTGEYHKGKQDGIHISWHENGQKSSKGEYSDGENVGTYEEWHENGRRDIEVDFSDGEMDGTYKWWYENGQIMFEVELEDGKINGSYEYWYENGQKRVAIDEVVGSKFENLFEIFRTVYRISESESARKEETIKCNGTYREWYENGELHWKAEFDDGIMDGDIKEWSESGKRLN